MDDGFDFARRKRDMMELWKETFHDSMQYVGLVFETYYRPDHSFTRYCENRLIASLLAIPYEFQILANDSRKRFLKAIYLCGLATRPEWRKKGIMSGLINETEMYFQTRGFDMAFLIPADDHLREYYKHMGFYDASFRKETEWAWEKISVVKEQKPLNIYAIRNFITDTYNEDFIKSLANWCREMEICRDWPSIVHSREDIIAAMRENENSILITDGHFDPEYPNLTNVVGVAFLELPEDSSNDIRIIEKYTRANLATIREDDIRNAILAAYDRKLIKEFKAVIEDPYLKRGVRPYAMVKPLISMEYFEENRKPIFDISLMLD